jgi:hypothetical protein
VSTPEQISSAATYESWVSNFSLLTGQLFAGLCQLTRLNLDMCRSAYSGAALHWECVMLAQTPEQFITRQADTLPWLAVQIAGYTRGWMDIASGTATKLSESNSDRYDENAHHVTAMFEGMAECARGVNAMVRAISPPRAEADSAPVARSQVDSRDIARAVLARAADAAAAAAKPHNASPRRRRAAR